MAKKVLVIHGPNLDLLGSREINVYGTVTLDDINNSLKDLGKELKVDIEAIQLSGEGEIVKKIGNAPKEGFSAIVINPAGYTHTSVAIRDAISAILLPVIEVHLSNIYAREEFRQKSLISPVAKGTISGLGVISYRLGLMAAVTLIS